MWCSSATARLNSVRAAAEQLTGKSTVPSVVAGVRLNRLRAGAGGGADQGEASGGPL